MKKLAIVLCVLLASVVSMNAQSGFGVKGGITYNSISDIDLKDAELSFSKKTGFNAGVLYRVKLPMGFALQPELLYIQKGSAVSYASSESYDFKMHYMQLPINVQWGIDLMLFRPFLMVSPYIGYIVGKGGEYDLLKWDDVNRFEYGLGLGAGIDIWRFQLTGRYCWDLGKVIDFKDIGFNISGKNKGFELSLALIF